MSTETLWDPDDWTTSNPTLFAAIAQYRYAIMAVVVLSAVLGYLGASLKPPLYEAGTTIFLSDSPALGDSASAIGPDQRVGQQAARLQSQVVFRQALSSVARGSDDMDIRDVAVEPDPSTGTISIIVSSTDPKLAADFANAIVQTYQQLSRDAIDEQVAQADDAITEQAMLLAQQAEELQQTVRENADDANAQRRLEAVQAQLFELQTRISDIKADAALFGTGVSNVEPAVPPVEPSGLDPLRYSLVGGLLGLSVASGVAYWRAGSVARSHVDPSAVLRVPLLAEIPTFRQAPGLSGIESILDAHAIEAYQFLLSSFESSITQSDTRAVLVTSPSPGDGKTTTSLHLARALAQQGSEVMLVDSDIRARGLTTMLNAQGSPGLVSLAEGEHVDSTIRRYRISESVKLSVVPSGPPPSHPTGLLSTTKYRKAVRSIIGANELTIIDGGPLLTVADPSALATQVDAILLVIDAETTYADLLHVRDRLQLIPTPLLGYVVNRVPTMSASPSRDLRQDPMPSHTRRLARPFIRARRGPTRPAYVSHAAPK